MNNEEYLLAPVIWIAGLIVGYIIGVNKSKPVENNGA